MIQTTSGALLLGGATSARGAKKEKMPVIFVGHGSPMNVIANNAFTKALSSWGKKLGTPKAIVLISAHWLTQQKTLIDASAEPKQIYDFGGFPDALYRIVYTPKGLPDLAASLEQHLEQRASALQLPLSVATSQKWGLDHGGWCVLYHMFPQVNIPVFQISIDYSAPAAWHYMLGEQLAYLREQGVLIMGSGNVVHNLRLIDRDFMQTSASRPWAKDLDEQVRGALNGFDAKALIQYERFSGAAQGIATPDHYYPLLYALGAAKGSSTLEYVYEGFELGTLSMRCVQWS